jgi:flavin reductase (DIM6/NTAB) family NADH-FMN oxidoreductase RutF
MEQAYSSLDWTKWDRFYRANFLNSLSGFKSASLIGTISESGIPNLAIFSNIVHLGADPALIGFVNRPLAAAPDTIRNIQQTGYYTINHIHQGICAQAHQTSAKYPANTNEFVATGLTELYREGIQVPFVQESRIQYLLSLKEVIPIQWNNTFFVIGAVEQVFLDDAYVASDGFIQLDQAGSLASCGLDAYYSASPITRLPYAKP